MPQRLNIQYIEDATKHRTLWAADTSAPLPPRLKHAGKFSDSPEHPYAFSYLKAYVAPAGAPQYPPPTADVSTRSLSATSRLVTLAMHGSTKANQIILAVPKIAELEGITIEGEHFDVPGFPMNSPLTYNLIACFSRDCANKTIVLQVRATSPIDLFLGEVRYGLPPGGERLIAARPRTAIASQNGDTTVLVNKVVVPGA
jgi:hypothetical protein